MENERERAGCEEKYRHTKEWKTGNRLWYGWESFEVVTVITVTSSMHS